MQGGAEMSSKLCFMLRLFPCDFIHIRRAPKQILRACFLCLQDKNSENLFAQAGGTGPLVISCDTDGSRREKKQTSSDSQE